MAYVLRSGELYLSSVDGLHCRASKHSSTVLDNYSRQVRFPGWLWLQRDTALVTAIAINTGITIQ